MQCPAICILWICPGQWHRYEIIIVLYRELISSLTILPSEALNVPSHNKKESMFQFGYSIDYFSSSCINGNSSKYECSWTNCEYGHFTVYRRHIGDKHISRGNTKRKCVLLLPAHNRCSYGHRRNKG